LDTALKLNQPLQVTRCFTLEESNGEAYLIEEGVSFFKYEKKYVAINNQLCYHRRDVFCGENV
jgi:hypothetical protein